MVSDEEKMEDEDDDEGMKPTCVRNIQWSLSVLDT